MPQAVAEIIFKSIWVGLLGVALIAQFIFKGRVKQVGGVMATMLVIAPYVIVFAWFSVRHIVGSFQPVFIVQLIGALLMLAGTVGYMVSIAYLRKNWAVSAAIKEGHTLVCWGPYKYVRHPMYFFMIMVVLGSGLLTSNVMIIIFTPVVAYLYYLRSGKEEEMLKHALPGYEEYSQRTRMLFPGII
ncbi:MAG: isoprenylcysteine carboxylmethyltransferase family protein [Candidatus Omnitrophota bacterium]